MEVSWASTIHQTAPIQFVEATGNRRRFGAKIDIRLHFLSSSPSTAQS